MDVRSGKKSRAVSTPVETSSTSETRGSARTILFVDDDQDQLSIYGTLLRRCGYNVIAANTPLEAVQVLDCVKVDLIISDVCMPGITGDELIEVLKQTDSIHNIPTILLTAGNSDLADKVLEDDGPDMFCLKSEAVRLLPAQVAFLLA